MRLKRILAVLASLLVLSTSSAGAGSSPPQRLRSALLMYPLIVSDGAHNTRVEIVNLTGTEKQLKCMYLTGDHCAETNFYVRLTANQPMSWLASQGTFNSKSSTRVPPFFGTGQLQCAVEPEQPDVDFHNAIQGRAVVFGSDGETLGYGAVGFERLTSGDFTGRADLNGATYTQCPDELHFAFLASDADAGSDSEIVLVPCSQDVLTTTPSTVVQIRLVNEFEQVLSASFTVSCQARRELDRISSAFTRATLGSETGHMILRGVQSPVLGMVIDRFTPVIGGITGDPAAAANEPILRGGRSATVVIP